MARILNTQSASPKEAAAYWREVICDTYVQLECEPERAAQAHDFFGEVVQNRISTIDVSTIDASPQKVIRTKALISRSSEDYFIVPIQAARGRCITVQDGRSAELSVGEFAIVDSTRPYELHYPEGLHQLTLKVPRALLLAQSPNAELLTATRVGGSRGAGHLLFDMVGVLLRNAPDLEPVSFEPVAASIVDVLTAGLRTISTALPVAPTALTGYHLQRIKVYAAAHLHDPALSVQSLAAALGMSVSSLYRVFDGQEQTLSESIWSQRLDRCRKDLSDPALKSLSVTQIGFRWGFSASSHFSHAFKRAYGQSPREFRQQFMRVVD